MRNGDRMALGQILDCERRAKVMIVFAHQIEDMLTERWSECSVARAAALP
jgi:hypothetical protein